MALGVSAIISYGDYWADTRVCHEIQIDNVIVLPIGVGTAG
jgi:hypothetical protein